MNSNRTFTMLKPDSIEQGNMLPILNMIESSGFKLLLLNIKGCPNIVEKFIQFTLCVL